MMEDYFKEIEEKVREAYEIASECRALGYDPSDKVEIFLARDIGERIEGILSVIKPEIVGKGLSKRIIELEEKYSFGDPRVALEIALEVATNKYVVFEDMREAIEFGIRVGLAYLTLGIVSAPIEGFVGVKIKKRRDGKDYLACYFGGPIRGAGGTAAALTVLIADFLRRAFKLSEYDPDEKEVQRYLIEVESYHTNVQRLQFLPSKEELIFLIEHIPVEITGDATTEREVLAYKDLERVETNKIRGGMCLVLCEGIAQKAKKLLKYVEEWGKEFGIEEWEFLKEYLKIQERAHTNSENENKSTKVLPDYRYIEETVAGRPIFSHPMARNGFRLRYGRSRLSGLAACSLNPATMHILDDFIATGSQLKLERPGKAAAITPCDLIEGPVVRLKGGDVIRVSSEEEAREIKNKVEKVLFLGDILISYGDFAEQNHVLLPSGYVEEWWVQELEKCIEEKGFDKKKYEEILKNPFNLISGREAVNISLASGVPLHPRYTYHWNYLEKDDFEYIYSKLKNLEVKFPLSIKFDERFKEILERICIPHKIKDNNILIEESDALPFLYSLGILPKFNEEKLKKALENFSDPINFLNEVSVLKIRNKIPITIGARLGRPEKAKMRRLKTRPHMLFPLGSQGGRMRSLNEALKKGYVEVEVPIFFCQKCNSKRIYRICRTCGSRTELYRICQNCGKYTKKKIHCGVKTKPFEKRRIDINSLVSEAVKRLDIKLPELVKGVKGTSSKGRVVEAIEKGILRARNRVYVNKDGTIRFDCIEVPITHFRPREIGLSVNDVRALGYKYDIFGNEIENEDQLIELFPQDVIIPDCDEWQEASAAEDLLRVANFIDELLVKFYGREPYYKAKTKRDLIGKLIVGLAPHTSVGVVGRIIGFSKTQGYFAHPLFHAAMRRNCDGDESCIMLLMDAFLNFSREYLPKKRGGSMDAPLVLTTRIILTEVDKEVYNLDIVDRYPIEFYEKTQEFVSPSEVKVARLIDKVDRNEYFGLKFTHDVSDLNIGVRVSAYKKLLTMKDKIEKEMRLAEKIVAVDKDDVARILIEKHFLKDIKGNLREFSKQEFRCVNCNEKYRRIPLSGKCEKCGGRIVFTVAEGMVYKYLESCEKLANSYNLPKYLVQALEIIKRRVDSVFGKDRQTLLNSYG